jgi:hypothetical protein
MSIVLVCNLKTKVNDLPFQKNRAEKNPLNCNPAFRKQVFGVVRGFMKPSFGAITILFGLYLNKQPTN